VPVNIDEGNDQWVETRECRVQTSSARRGYRDIWIGTSATHSTKDAPVSNRLESGALTEVMGFESWKGQGTVTSRMEEAVSGKQDTKDSWRRTIMDGVENGTGNETSEDDWCASSEA